MPRTKQRKVKRNSGNFDQILRDYNRYVQLKIHNVDIEFKALERKFSAKIQTVLFGYPSEIQNMTLREICAPDESPKKENIPPKTPGIQKQLTKSIVKVTRSTNPKRVTAVSDDGYQSESASQVSKMISMTSIKNKSQERTKKRSRSISQDRKSKLSVASTTKKMKNDVMKTPTGKSTNTFVITPKIKLNSAMNVLRKPKDGEMVFSTQGSPLLVSTTVSDRTANINVPLRNGNVMALLPFNETSLSENFHLDEETKHQLKILQSHLNKVLK